MSHDEQSWGLLKEFERSLSEKGRRRARYRRERARRRQQSKRDKMRHRASLRERGLPVRGQNL